MLQCSPLLAGSPPTSSSFQETSTRLAHSRPTTFSSNQEAWFRFSYGAALSSLSPSQPLEIWRHPIALQVIYHTGFFLRYLIPKGRPTFLTVSYSHTTGDYSFDPLGLAKKGADKLKVNELKNGRLAMLAFSGIVTQSALGHTAFPCKYRNCFKSNFVDMVAFSHKYFDIFYLFILSTQISKRMCLSKSTTMDGDYLNPLL